MTTRITEILKKPTGFQNRVQGGMDTRYKSADWTNAEAFQSKYRYSGVNYNHFGSRGAGLSSMAESQAVIENMQRNALGTIVTELKKEGGGTMNYKNRLYQTDENGKFVIVDGEKLKKKKQIRDEHNNYIYEIVRNIADSEEDICAVLGFGTFPIMDSELKPGGFGGLTEMPQVLVDADARPDYIRACPPESKELNLAIAKLMYIAGQKDNIIWEDNTGTNASDEKNRSY